MWRGHILTDRSYTDANKKADVVWKEDTLVRSIRISIAKAMHCGVAVTKSTTVRVPREPKEVHSRHKDGVRWAQEGEGQE